MRENYYPHQASEKPQATEQDNRSLNSMSETGSYMSEPMCLLVQQSGLVDAHLRADCPMLPINNLSYVADMVQQPYLADNKLN